MREDETLVAHPTTWQAVALELLHDPLKNRFFELWNLKPYNPLILGFGANPKYYINPNKAPNPETLKEGKPPMARGNILLQEHGLLWNRLASLGVAPRVRFP